MDAGVVDDDDDDEDASTGDATVADASDDAAADSGTASVDAATTSLTPSVLTYAGTSLGLSAFSANGRIQPHGLPTSYYFEYGTTTAYGAQTPTKDVAPRLAAFYRESFDTGLGGWRGGAGTDLVYQPSGGVSGGFARYTEPTGDDYNHVDGIGVLHLVEYFYPGTFDMDAPTAALGGADPDLRDAKIHLAVRGNQWQTSGSELVWWSQIDITHGASGMVPVYSNWAHTGFFLTDHLFSGTWENVDYTLYNDTTDWTYAGSNRAIDAQLGRHEYDYAPIDEVLSHLDTDLFHLLTYIDVSTYPSGSIDFDDTEIAYRNHSLVFPSNGATLTSAPAGSADDPAALTDGWRNGAGHMWASAPSPQAPQEIEYTLDRPVTIARVQLHQHTDWPSKNVEVLASADGVSWTTIVQGVMPATHPAGANFAYLLTKGLSAPARKIKVRILDGYQAAHWGLGEIEIFGSGAQMKTDDDWYRVNADVMGLTSGATYHYRLVAVAGGQTLPGPDMTFLVPATTIPEVATGTAGQLMNGTAKVEGRLNTLGAEAQVHFEFGSDTSYGRATDPKRAGPEITPRTLKATLDGLTPGSTVHYRFVAVGSGATVYGDDQVFVAQ